MLDARYHVNLAWHAREMDSVFAASQVLSDTPSRGWDQVPPSTPGLPPVPTSVSAWKGKAVLREAGPLESVETVVLVAGGRVRYAGEGVRDLGPQQRVSSRPRGEAGAHGWRD